MAFFTIHVNERHLDLRHKIKITVGHRTKSYLQSDMMSDQTNQTLMTIIVKLEAGFHYHGVGVVIRGVELTI